MGLPSVFVHILSDAIEPIAGELQLLDMILLADDVEKSVILDPVRDIAQVAR